MKQNVLLTFSFLSFVAWLPQASAACTVDRSEMVSAVEAGLSALEIGASYDGCKAKEKNAKAKGPSINGMQVSNTGSIRFEALHGCGYHPQRKEATCPIIIKQRDGYGGVPDLQPSGSYEYVLFCVDYGDGNGLTRVNANGVHVHDEEDGDSPRWLMSAVIPANARLFERPLDSQTLSARAILSWASKPTTCDFIPVYGNQVDFKIRLDP